MSIAHEPAQPASASDAPTSGAQAVAAAASPAPTLVIKPRPGWHLIDLPELWRYRQLLWILALRDVKVRYKQTFVGVAWAVLQPFMTMVVFTLLFKLMGRVPVAEGVPYAVSTYCALLPWQLFATSLTQSSESLVTNQNLITKVYFPRGIVPIAPIIAGLIDFAIAFGILIAMMVFYGITPSWAVVLLPVFVLMAVITSLSVGLWLSALNALYRDIRYAVPFLVQIGMFISPVVYETAEVIPPAWRAVYSLNPMVGVVEGFRWALLGHAHPPIIPMLVSTAAVIVICFTGTLYFRRVERTIADKV